MTPLILVYNLEADYTTHQVTTNTVFHTVEYILQDALTTYIR